MFRSSLLMVSVFVAGGYARGVSTELVAQMHHHTPDVRELLASARGRGDLHAAPRSPDIGIP